MGESELQRMNRELTAIYLERRPVPGKRIVIDVDSTDDPAYGQQAFYHGYYCQHMFHPLLVFDGGTGDLLAANLHPALADAFATGRPVLIDVAVHRSFRP